MFEKISVTPNIPSSLLPIGIFDSGVGGLSVLRHIHALLPQEHLIYFADGGFAPYGDKPEAVVAARALGIADFLVQRGVKALVVACNTATVAAIKLLRFHYPELVIVGVEPGLKPAALVSRSGKIGVLATEGTLQGEKFLLLRKECSAASHVQFLLQACTGLADLIELGALNSAATLAMLEGYIAPLLAQGADTLVLGCTHYPFVQQAINAITHRLSATPVTLIDTGAAVARQLQRLLATLRLLREFDPDADEKNAATTRIAGYTSGQAGALDSAFASLLGLHPQIAQVVL